MSTSLAETFAALKARKPTVLAQPTSAAFAADAHRFDKYHVVLGDLLFDYSKQRIDGETLGLLQALAAAAGVEAKRDAMFRGDLINTTEKRAVLHTALRNPEPTPVVVSGHDFAPEIAATRESMLAFASDVREGRLKGASGKAITDVINIGIGGSDLGPAMAARALAPFGKPGLRCHFVSNVDGADIHDTLAGLDAATTLFIVSSKTFTTLETMTNAKSAREWIVAALGEPSVGAHFAAVSTNLEKVREFGIDGKKMFGFWDWIGGRYSVWSSIGLPVAIAIGPERFKEFLQGGHDIDVHFCTAPAQANIPLIMGLLSVWNRNILGSATQTVIPYDQRLGRFPAYLQQLQMESNGKSVRLDGSPVEHETGAVVWGEPGTNGQHAFFQLIHQGTEVCPVDFLVAANPTDADKTHHEYLVANCLAQGEALMRGRTREEAKAFLQAQGVADAEAERLAPHKRFPGSRPTSTFLYRELTPRMLGRLIALYEHKVFTEGVIWGINSFDQWGVELGKELASKLAPVVMDRAAKTDHLDSSTAGLVAHLRKLMK